MPTTRLLHCGVIVPLIWINDGGQSSLHAQGNMTQAESHSQQTYLAAEGAMSEALRQYLTQQSRLCEKLEQLADALPDSADKQDCLQMAQAIVPLVKRVHDYEEKTIFPWLTLARREDQTLQTTLDRLRYEHMGDEEYATDLSVALRDYVTQRATSNTEALAWMLRGFFEGMRRHIAFEREHILPLMDSRPL